MSYDHYCAGEQAWARSNFSHLNDFSSWQEKNENKFKNNNNNRNDIAAAVAAIASKIEQQRNSIVNIKANV